MVLSTTSITILSAKQYFCIKPQAIGTDRGFQARYQELRTWWLRYCITRLGFDN
jgi:hypothetical protein